MRGPLALGALVGSLPAAVEARGALRVDRLVRQWELEQLAGSVVMFVASDERCRSRWPLGLQWVRAPSPAPSPLT